MAAVVMFYLKTDGAGCPCTGCQPMSQRHSITVPFVDNDLARHLFGSTTAICRAGRDSRRPHHHPRTTVFVEGERVLAELAQNLLNQLYGLLKEGYPLHPNDIEYAARMLSSNDRLNLKDIFLTRYNVTAKKKRGHAEEPDPESLHRCHPHSRHCVRHRAGRDRQNYLAMAMAVAAFTKGQVGRIILTRPAVEAGETLGFLPGDLRKR